MKKIKFNNCLNKEPKIYNIPVGSLIGLGIIGIICWMTKGLILGFAGGAVGFITGDWLMKQWWLGNMQRWMYWNLPKVVRDIPASHFRTFM